LGIIVVRKLLLDLPRWQKRSLALGFDFCAALLAVAVAFELRLEHIPFGGNAWVAYLLAPALALPIMIVNGLYRAIFRYSDLVAFRAIAGACVIYAGLYATALFTLSPQGVPRTLGFIQPLVFCAFVVASRAAARFFLGGLYQQIVEVSFRPKALIYGAGQAGRQIASLLADGKSVKVVGFVDQSMSLQGSMLSGLPVFSPHDLGRLIEREEITEVLLAMPSLSRSKRHQLIEDLSRYGVHVRALPLLTDLALGRVSVEDLRELEIEDLIERTTAEADRVLLEHKLANKVVLVTGAGGSIGSELCRQILECSPAKVVLLDHSEPDLYRIESQLNGLRSKKPSLDQIKISTVLASVRDADRITAIFSAHQPDIVFHAAAYKHVPLLEKNLAIGTLNNLFGTLNCARAAIQSGTSEFVLISTDKAVRPSSVMGATKRLAEMVLQGLFAESVKNVSENSAITGAQGTQSLSTMFTMVRFGNVLGSSGSVVPLFRRQLERGGPLTVTHPEVSRYFMTIAEAVTLVLQASAMARGGEVFVLDMGEPVKILDLAKRVIQLSGLKLRDKEHPDGDIEIEFIGLRPGEKLYEELLIGDNPQATAHPRIMRALEQFIPWQELSPKLDRLYHAAMQGDEHAVRDLLKELVPAYKTPQIA
jgi:FlaA1/EpsC-like NDP-sugar epimerase